MFPPVTFNAIRATPPSVITKPSPNSYIPSVVPEKVIDGAVSEPNGIVILPLFCSTLNPFGPVIPPAKVEVAVVLVALKYGAPILPHASIPPAKEEVAVDLIQMGMVVVGVSALMPNESVCCCQS